jgi:hypothetical protein
MSLIFSIIGAVVTLGGVFIGIGVIKGKLTQAVETNAAQSKQIDECASRKELTEAIKRSDEMLAIMRSRADEDRAAGEGRYKELYGIITLHGERIVKLETSHEAVLKSLDEIKTNLRTGFADIREELKELRKQV